MNKKDLKSKVERVDLLIELTSRAITERNAEAMLGSQKDRLLAERGLLISKLKGKNAPKTKRN